MSKSAPGKSYRKGISLKAAIQSFGDDAKAEAWFISRRWPDGIQCVYCDSKRVSDKKSNRKTPMHHCKDCGKDFTIKTGTIMQDSKLSLSEWALAFYLFTTSLKGVSSMKLHRDLEIRQPSAWYLAHRIREAWLDETDKMGGPVEADETYFGGKEANKHADKKLHAGRGPVGKTAVAGLKDRTTNKVKTQVVESTDAPTLQGFVRRYTDKTAQLYTDESPAYLGINRAHEAVKHSVSEFVRGQAHTNGMESHWALLKRGHDGVYHHFSEKHLPRYITEFEGRHNNRPMDTTDQMSLLVKQSVGKHLPYAKLIGQQESTQMRML